MADTIVITTSGDSVTATLYGKNGVQSFSTFYKRSFLRCALALISTFEIETGETKKADWENFIKGKCAFSVNSENIDSFLAECENRGLIWAKGKTARELRQHRIVAKREKK